MKVFLDVGANMGQTARAVLDPRYRFERIVSFEPAPPCWPSLEAIDDPRFELCGFGLWSETCRGELYDPGNPAASVFPDYLPERRISEEVASIGLVRASDWLATNIGDGEVVFMKLNCEGAEAEIVEDLRASGQLRRIYNLMVFFDVRKSASLRRREAPLRKRLRRAGYRNIAFSEDVVHGRTHAEGIRCWLDLVGARESLPLDELRRRHGDLLASLSQRTGRRARYEHWLRDHVYQWLPGGSKRAARAIWRRLPVRR
ncbi:MAG TPA: FkbM family methyltransferase [Solirubrobacterales bacterium]|nr:FkbM family methyltransferase [Solirubrobacterales bacterium]